MLHSAVRKVTARHEIKADSLKRWKKRRTMWFINHTTPIKLFSQIFK